MVIDEIHTPDSSRFWRASTYEDRFACAEEPESFDKEMVRLAYAAKGFRGEGEPPELGESFWESVSARYIQIYEMLTAKPFERGSYPLPERVRENLAKKGWLQ
jgi:phosphoribosylaminoimidazole-succinocarboxamide synthase